MVLWYEYQERDESSFAVELPARTVPVLYRYRYRYECEVQDTTFVYYSPSSTTRRRSAIKIDYCTRRCVCDKKLYRERPSQTRKMDNAATSTSTTEEGGMPKPDESASSKTGEESSSPPSLSAASPDSVASQTLATVPEQEESSFEPLKMEAEGTTSEETLRDEASSTPKVLRGGRVRSSGEEPSKELSSDFSVKSSRSLRSNFARGAESIRNLRQTMIRSTGSVADLARALAASSVTNPDLLSPVQCSAIVINYISAGYILLPYAFYQAGYVYSSCIFALVALQSYVTSLYILETCARAESQRWHSSRHGLPGSYLMTIRDMQYELSALQHMFLGPRWTKFFLVTTACDLYSITWVMSTIFGEALSQQVPIAGIDDDYKFWVFIFLVITVPLSCTHVLDQVLLQFIFLGGRMLMVVLMIGTVVAAFLSGDEDNDHFGGETVGKIDTPAIDLTQTMTIIQTAIFSTAFQFSVPSMAGIASSKDSMTGIFRHAVTFVYVSNCLLAVLMAIYFGSATNPSSNINWSNYHTGNAGWSKFVSGYVVMFAALDGLAVFPLLCSNLGGILLAGVFGDKAALTDQDMKTQIFFRLVASLPQSIGALYVNDLSVIAKYGGIFTLLSYSAAPTILYIASGRRMREKGLPEETCYSSKLFSHYWIAYGLLVTTALVVLGVVVDAVLQN